MTTIKSYTDLEQSKKLAEILPLESADMYYFLDPTPAGNIYHIVTPQIDFGVKTREPEYNEGDIPCWSLAALFSMLPKSARLERGSATELYGVSLPVELKASDWYINPVDACYEMIVKLHDLYHVTI